MFEGIFSTRAFLKGVDMLSTFAFQSPRNASVLERARFDTLVFVFQTRVFGMSLFA